MLLCAAPLAPTLELPDMISLLSVLLMSWFAWWAESQSNWQKIHMYRPHSASNPTNKINLSASCFVILSLESVDEILWYYQSNETSLSDFFHSAIYVVISI